MGTYFSGAACNFSANEELEMQGRMLQFMVKKCLDNFDKTVVGKLRKYAETLFYWFGYKLRRF